MTRDSDITVHHKRFVRMIRIDADSTSVVNGFRCSALLPRRLNFVFEHTRIRCLTVMNTIKTGQRWQQQKKSSIELHRLRTRTMIRSEQCATMVKVVSAQCACRPTAKLKKRWSGLGLPFFRMLLAVVSLKCKRPTVIFDTWSWRSSTLKVVAVF